MHPPSTHIHLRLSAKSSSGVEGTEMKRASFINEEEPSFLSSFLPFHIFASIPRLRSIKPRLIPAAAEGGEGGGVKCQVAREKTFSPRSLYLSSTWRGVLHLLRPAASRFSSYFHMHSRRALCLIESQLIMTCLSFTLLLCKILVLSRTHI